jgi:pantoate--beta-alanine ligase
VIAGTRAELAELLVPHRAAGRRVGLVCTMGAMHEGHASLMRRTRLEIGPDAPLVVSLFVNPLQFGPNEDLARYPRTFDEDVALCAREGVDIVFAPTVDEVYPGGDPQVTVDPGPLAGVLEGKTRPGHYVGVLTVVAKLFGLVRPEVTVFGEKDYQQLALVRRMSGDLCLGVEVLGGETVREPDGLALSSRNRYLDPEQRQQAVALSRALRAAQEAGPEGYAAALAAAEKVLADAPGVDLDYVVVRGVDLAELDEDARGEARALVAAKVGTTRLIDNMPVVLGAPLRH